VVDEADLPGAVDDEGRGHRAHLPPARDRVPLVPGDGERRAVLLRELEHALLLVVDGDADDLHLVAEPLRELLELRERLLAGLTPRRPEIDDDGLATSGPERERPLPVEGLDRQIRRLLSD